MPAGAKFSMPADLCGVGCILQGRVRPSGTGKNPTERRGESRGGGLTWPGAVIKLFGLWSLFEIVWRIYVYQRDSSSLRGNRLYTSGFWSMRGYEVNGSLRLCSMAAANDYYT